MSIKGDVVSATNYTNNLTRTSSAMHCFCSKVPARITALGHRKYLNNYNISAKFIISDVPNGNEIKKKKIKITKYTLVVVGER